MPLYQYLHSIATTCQINIEPPTNQRPLEPPNGFLDFQKHQAAATRERGKEKIQGSPQRSHAAVDWETRSSDPVDTACAQPAPDKGRRPAEREKKNRDSRARARAPPEQVVLGARSLPAHMHSTREFVLHFERQTRARPAAGMERIILRARARARTHTCCAERGRSALCRN